MHSFPVGTKVETNEVYFEKFGRRVVGVSAEMPIKPSNRLMPILTAVRCEYQEGNAVKEYLGNVVVMLTSDLKKHVLH